MGPMSQTTVDTYPAMESSEFRSGPGLTLAQAQQVIYDFLLEIVKIWHPEDVLEEFRHLFIHHTDSVSSQTLPALHIILFANNEQEFRHTIKRCCYILVNNWEVSRQYDAIQSLVSIFSDPLLQRRTLSPTLKRLRHWLIDFTQSDDFEELRLFAARYSEDRTLNRPDEWASRYTSYLLVSQYVNESNPVEQRHAARMLSRRLKEKFKFDLAMYTAYGQSGQSHGRPVQNPTALGDSTLRLVKTIVAKRGEFSYKNLSRLFLEQIKDSTYGEFKRSLPRYLLYSISGNSITQQIHEHLEDRLANLYSEFEYERLNPSLLLRTSNRTIDYLMTEDLEHPSSLFSLVLSQGNALTLVIILLKLILVSRRSLPYLEARVASLIRYYEQFPRSECQWVINFLEVFQITFAIYGENIEYNLVQINPNTSTGSATVLLDNHNLETFRIFSQTIDQHLAGLLDGNEELPRVDPD
ncbi:hypothetical protein [Nodosilinea sp. E11]|uniref:hypothetical protein n=1 Tax=Nodosilinea sp. E11 TaxID=3037479 RepID=UPI0029346B0D|nr:hypothetical protein [Nodosilinea sp. E11]WOD39323.1 hypothetical protein RRF56_24245 [Nodosilinea sp. E11]